MNNNYTIQTISRSANKNEWQITFAKEPTPKEIEFVIGKTYPPQGYGQSVYFDPKISESGFWKVLVISNSSCD